LESLAAASTAHKRRNGMAEKRLAVFMAVIPLVPDKVSPKTFRRQWQLKSLGESIIQYHADMRREYFDPDGSLVSFKGMA
jgi:hypothetical protein